MAAEIVEMRSTESSHFFTVYCGKKCQLKELKRFDPIVRRHVRYVKHKLRK